MFSNGASGDKVVCQDIPLCSILNKFCIFNFRGNFSCEFLILQKHFKSQKLVNIAKISDNKVRVHANYYYCPVSNSLSKARQWLIIVF